MRKKKDEKKKKGEGGEGGTQLKENYLPMETIANLSSKCSN